jgi:GTP-binding protein
MAALPTPAPSQDSAAMLPAEFSADELAAGDALFARPWRFVKSVPSLEFLPATDRHEIAFAGRSNVGKSSLFNALVRQRGLARTSNTPGRTQELNFFEAPGLALYLVDMPGYGFAKAPKANVVAWTLLVKAYLRGRPNLLRVVLLIDVRHGLKDTDLGTMALMDEAGVSYQAVLTKADKIKPHQLAEVVARTQAELEKHAAAYPVVLVSSAQDGLGVAELRAEIARLAAAHGVRAGA